MCITIILQHWKLVNFSSAMLSCVVVLLCNTMCFGHNPLCVHCCHHRLPLERHQPDALLCCCMLQWAVVCCVCDVTLYVILCLAFHKPMNVCIADSILLADVLLDSVLHVALSFACCV